MSKKAGNIEIFMEPVQKGGADNLLKTIVDFIDGSTKRLFIVVQELDCKQDIRLIRTNGGYSRHNVAT